MNADDSGCVWRKSDGRESDGHGKDLAGLHGTSAKCIGTKAWICQEEIHHLNKESAFH